MVTRTKASAQPSLQIQAVKRPSTLKTVPSPPLQESPLPESVHQSILQESPLPESVHQSHSITAIKQPSTLKVIPSPLQDSPSPESDHPNPSITAIKRPSTLKVIPSPPLQDSPSPESDHPNPSITAIKRPSTLKVIPSPPLQDSPSPESDHPNPSITAIKRPSTLKVIPSPPLQDSPSPESDHPNPSITAIKRPSTLKVIPSPPLQDSPSPKPAASHAPKQKFYQALYNYNGSGSGELDLIINDILIILERSPNGWVKGRLEKNGLSGWLPQSYIEEWTLDSDLQEIKNDGHSDDFEEGVEYKAVYSYHGNSNNELSFSSGDIIIVLEECDNGWWRGNHDNTQGWFPGSYVQPCDDENGDVNDAQAPHNVDQPDGRKQPYGEFEVIPQLMEAMKARGLTSPKRRAPEPPVGQKKAKPLSPDRTSMQSYTSEGLLSPRTLVPRPNNAAMRLAERHENKRISIASLGEENGLEITPGGRSSMRLVKIKAEAVKKGAESRYQEAPSRPTPPPPEAIRKYTLKGRKELAQKDKQNDSVVVDEKIVPKPKPRERTSDRNGLSVSDSSARLPQASDRTVTSLPEKFNKPRSRKPYYENVSFSPGESNARPRVSPRSNVGGVQSSKAAVTHKADHSATQLVRRPQPTSRQLQSERPRSSSFNDIETYTEHYDTRRRSGTLMHKSDMHIAHSPSYSPERQQASPSPRNHDDSTYMNLQMINDMNRPTPVPRTRWSLVLSDDSNIPEPSPRQTPLALSPIPIDRYYSPPHEEDTSNLYENINYAAVINERTAGDGAETVSGAVSVNHGSLTSTPLPKQHNALFTYTAHSKDELSFKAGDVIVELETFDGSGWCQGMLQDGSVGLYPSNYVQLMTEL
uniref:Uncharacterized protein LOC102800513 n=1 Tax=Saccoglossus kowalevskii TaxID=10224 RepID=A0ABM0MAD7_SACKO|nr:PREDICTED: uncharacterized protein LOC102800513 [Saccoglossus kowalevskii]